MNSHCSLRHDPHDALCGALTSLLKAAIKDHGTGAPALTAVAIHEETSSSDLCLLLHFADGYQLSSVLTRREVRPFCIAHGIRSRAELEERLLDEALPMYARLRASCFQEVAADEEVADDESAAFFEVGTPAAREKGMRLLFLRLTPLQRRQLTNKGYFEVIGGDTGRCYRIWRGRVRNVDQLDTRGRRVCTWCFYPRGRLVTGDIMLAQKLALQLCETATLRIAGRERGRLRTPLVGATTDPFLS